MAVRNYYELRGQVFDAVPGVSIYVPKNATIIVWAGLLNGDTGTPYLSVNASDKCFSVSAATFGVSGSISLEGSNDCTDGISNGNWQILQNPASAALTFTAFNLKQVLENPLWTRPHVTAGDGTTNLTAYLVLYTPRQSN